MKSNRVSELDSIRGIAAIAVVIYHYFYRYNDLFGHKNISAEWSYLGRHGVEIFFIVSGFVIFWSLNRVKHPVDFIVSRISRLYPVYWASVILTFCLVSTIGLEGRSVDFIDALINLTMLQEFFRTPSVDGVYWTLTIELIFYFWIFSLFIFKLHNRADVFLGIFVLASALSSLFSFNISNALSKLLLFDHMSFFVSGICFFKILNGIDKKRAFVILILCLFSTAITYSALHLPFFLIIYSFFYCAITGKLRFMKNKLLVFLGGISYALYLVHQNIGYIVINYFYEEGTNGLVGILVAFIISLALAFLLTTLIEKPALVSIREFYMAYRSKLISSS